MDQNAKQLAVERLKNSANILVTVSNNPDVDDLSAMIGFSLLLGKLGKHASAVFSGQVPPAINFLQPDARLEKDVSSLRDFIIALDKDKADKLRYKVEENVVKIFITPYKTKISQDDLSFSEGDFNVDTVVALGVSKRDDLDNAIKAHGRILHDAAVITVNAGPKTSDLGSIDWQDPSASSLCEMLVSISESFGSGLLDEQISTAFLTGIVAATERFSNNKTSPKVMTMAAQLMAAGANQQLISNNLQASPQIPVTQPEPGDDGSQLSIDHGSQQNPPQPAQPVEPSAELPPPQAPASPPPPPVVAEPQPETSPPPLEESKDEEAVSRPKDKSIKELEDEIANMASTVKAEKKRLLPASAPEAIDDEKDQDSNESNRRLISRPKGHGPRDIDQDPMLGGTFNATSQQAHEDSVSDIKKSVNSTLLSHPGKPLEEEDVPKEDKPESKGRDLQPLTLGQTASEGPDSQPSDNDSSVGAGPSSSEGIPAPPAEDQAKPGEEPGAQLDVDEARRAVEEAMNAQTFDPANNPIEAINSQPLPQEQPPNDQEISIDDSGNLQLPGQVAVPPPGDTNQEFKLPS